MQLPRTKEWREAAGLTQRQLSKESGVGKGTIVRIENGESATPRTAKKIADTLNISVADLLESPPVPLGQAPTSSKPAEGAEESKEWREELLEEERGAYKEQRHTADEVEEAGSFKMPVERTSPEPSTKEERLETLRDSTRECLDMADEALREFEALKQSGTKRQLEILGGRALCTYLGAAYLTNLALNAGHRQGMTVDDEERQAREDAVHAVNKLGDAASEIMEASRASGMVIGMREYQLRRATG
jgi:transcriptional regulator with XRE-family HTH domain